MHAEYSHTYPKLTCARLRKCHRNDDSAQPRNRSTVTRPFSSLEGWGLGTRLGMARMKNDVIAVDKTSQLGQKALLSLQSTPVTVSGHISSHT